MCSQAPQDPRIRQAAKDPVTITTANDHLAIDAMEAVLVAVGDRLGENERPLRDALRQLQMAFVQRKNDVGAAN